MPEKGRWTKSGCLYDELGRWSVAWRVHDAQHWGVPQRRKRIALIADFGGLSAPEILFERQGLSWNPDESQPAGKEAAAGAGGGSPGAVTLRIRGGCEGGGKGALIQTERSGALGTNQDQTLFVLDRPSAYGFEPGAAKRLDPENRFVPEGTPTLRAEMGDNQTSVVVLNDQSGSAMGVSEDVTGALRAQEHGHQPLVAAFMGGQGSKAGGLGYHEEVSPSLKSVPSGGNTVPTVYDARGNGDGQIAPTITGDHQNRVTDYTAVCLGFSSNYEVGNDMFPVLRSHESGGCSEHVMQYRTVRRLTPLECERLQGYPDGWTDIGDWTDSKGKKHRAADSPRYKALGNSIALPYWKVLLKRISAQYDRDATMGSLFDGIGGFPLCWEQINGKGSALWASEIEEFPIAVTKLRFPEDGTA